MTQATHTPGHWLMAAKPSSVVGWPIVATPSGRSICSLNYVQHSSIDPKVSGDDAFNRESRANGLLIAAAPDLLEAVIQYRDDLKRPPSADSIERRLAMVNAAIAKALGEQS
jgi:hypothetical protein